MSQPNANRFHPKRWTVVTWLAILFWAWQALPRNYPPSVFYTRDPATGEHTVLTHRKSLSDIPYSVGWPLPYIWPSFFQITTFPPPPPGPSNVSLLAMAANFVLIVSEISALVYLLQKFLFQFSLLTLFVVMSAYPLQIGLSRLIAMVAGHNAAHWWLMAVYFSPIPIALAVRHSLYPRIHWARFRPNLNPLQRSLEAYDNPDDAMAAAAELDTLGDWNDSIDLYRQAAQRWPEHTEYIQNCIDRVAEKQALAKA